MLTAFAVSQNQQGGSSNTPLGEPSVKCQTMLCCSEGTVLAFGLQQTGCFYRFAAEGCETQGVKEWPAAGRLGPGDSSGFDSACWQCTFHIMSWAAR